jgi:hypothetical protein
MTDVLDFYKTNADGSRVWVGAVSFRVPDTTPPAVPCMVDEDSEDIIVANVSGDEFGIVRWMRELTPGWEFVRLMDDGEESFAGPGWVLARKTSPMGTGRNSPYWDLEPEPSPRPTHWARRFVRFVKKVMG